MAIKADGISILSPDQNRIHSVQIGRRLQYLTIVWNSAEFVIAIVAGFLAGSVALIGFGFDSAIEVASSIAALWRLGRDHDEESRGRAEQYALRMETRQTEICAYLSAILLLGLVLNAWLDWWWADPLAGLAMVPFIAWEGWGAIQGRTCCDH